MFRFFLCCGLIGFFVNCSSINDRNRLEVYERNPRNEALRRAQGLNEIGETTASLNALKRILREDPPDEVSLEALILFADIQNQIGHPKEALKKIEEFIKRNKSKTFNLSRVNAARKRAEGLLDSKKVGKEHEQVVRPQSSSTPARLVSRSIGVIIPLSGTFKVYGERIFAALKLALPDSQIRRTADASVFSFEDGSEVIVMDSMGKSETSEHAVDLLVDNYNVGIIVGDILSETALAISKRSAQRDVINVSLSRKDGITEIGPRVFQMAITPRRQVEKLLAPMDGGHYENVAVLYPENAFGLEMKNAFVEVARENKINVTSVVGYDPSQTTYTSYIRQLVGPKSTASNEIFERCQQKANQITDFAAKKKAERDCLENVAPRVGFDALFIPEFPKNLGYIIPALISEGVMVSKNESLVHSHRKTSGNDNARSVQLLGPSSFNNLSVAEKLGNQAEGALFVDSAQYDDSRDEVSKFNDEFENLIGTPPVLSEAIAFDAIKNAREILNKSGNENTIDFSILSDSFRASSHDGLVGVTVFNDARESNIPLNLFSYYEGKIVRND